MSQIPLSLLESFGIMFVFSPVDNFDRFLLYPRLVDNCVEIHKILWMFSSDTLWTVWKTPPLSCALRSGRPHVVHKSVDITERRFPIWTCPSRSCGPGPWNRSGGS